MAETIAIARRYDRERRFHGGEELRARRGLAAMVRHEQYVRAQVRRGAIDEQRFGCALDVSGQQHRARSGGNAQHAGKIVRLARCRIAGRRVQQRESHAVPLPFRSRAGRHAIPAPPSAAVRFRQRRHELVDLEVLDDGTAPPE
jgi:hypothetical protein